MESTRKDYKDQTLWSCFVDICSASFPKGPSGRELAGNPHHAHHSNESLNSNPGGHCGPSIE